MDEIAPTDADLRGVSFHKLDKLGSVQWPCNDKAPDGTPLMHVDRFVRGKGKFMITEFVPTEERTGPRFPLLLTTGPHPRRSTMSARRPGAPTTAPGMRRTCWRSTRSMRRAAASRTATSSRWRSRSGDIIALRAEDLRADAAGRGLHHLPPRRDRRQRHHHRLLGLGDELPGIQGDGGRGPAHQLFLAMAGRRISRKMFRCGVSLEGCGMQRNSARRPASGLVCRAGSAAALRGRPAAPSRRPRSRSRRPSTSSMAACPMR